MATFSTFGVTPETLTARVANLGASSRTSPGDAGFEDIINGVAGRVCSAASSKRIAWAGLDETDETYQNLREMVINGSLAQILVGRLRVGVDGTASFYERQFNDAMEQLRSRTEEVQQRDGGPNMTDYIGSQPDDLDVNGFGTSMVYKTITGGI